MTQRMRDNDFIKGVGERDGESAFDRPCFRRAELTRNPAKSKAQSSTRVVREELLALRDLHRFVEFPFRSGNQKPVKHEKKYEPDGCRNGQPNQLRTKNPERYKLVTK